MNAHERREFVRSHRTAIFGYNRRDHGPAMTVVYYVMDGDDLLVSTMAARAKAKAVARNPRVSLSILDEKWPPTYLLVYGTARIVTDFDAVVELGVRISALMAQQSIAESYRPHVAEMTRREQRVMLRITPYMTFESPPRHVYKPDDVKGLTHGLGTSLPWDASP
ncbi:MAG: TIGR03618 family F420-dependent PPOX class oxidoreductase [Candidatus Rokubacteria bacterium]|nr:TIGR03618 family F420-dependent PPOX class oxidoreductase [Candidatus Rokubacteria bacterium]